MNNIFWLCAGLLVVLLLLWRRHKQKQAYTRLSSNRLSWLYKFSWIILILYSLIGYLDQFQLQCAQSSCSPLDMIFQYVPQESGYSAPLAAHSHQIDQKATQNLQGWHLLGTNINGRDTIYLISKATGTILKLVLGSMAISFPLGLILGLIAGYKGGLLDDVIQWLYNTIASIPWLLFMIAFLIVFGRDLIWICVAFGLTSWIELSRLVRAETLKIKELNYIKSARSLGLSTPRILFRHILPNLTHITAIHFSLTASAIILAESILTFIGIGVDAGSTSFGSMIVDAQAELMRSPPIWWVFAGASLLGIMPLVLSLNYISGVLSDNNHQG